MPPLEFAAPTVYVGAASGRVLKQPTPPEDLGTPPACGIMYGLTFGKAAREATKEQETVAAIATATPSDKIVGDNSPARVLLEIAAHSLAGEVASKKGQIDQAIPALEEAVRLQDGLPYTEPPPWYYPVRHSLGAILLTAGRAAEAETVYREDLRRNPENGWALYGLTQSLQTQKKTEEAAATETRFKKAWARADVKLTASRF
jgi:tetratricopeptide (TPR) repeat protein